MKHLALLVLLLTASSSTGAQTDHQWITEEPRYIREDGIHCCGAEHCKPKAIEWYKDVPNGIYIPETAQTFIWGRRGLYFSQRREPWGCYNTSSKQYDCAFVMGHGT